MHSNSNPETIGEVFHKKGTQKNLNAKGHMPLGQRPQAKGLKEGTTPPAQMQMSNGQQPEPISKHRLRKQRLNAEIDSFLTNLLNEGMINEQFWNFHAKACHLLGLQTCNRIAVNARNGANSQRLYAFKIKGAMQQHLKNKYDELSTPDLDSPQYQ